MTPASCGSSEGAAGGGAVGSLSTRAPLKGGAGAGGAGAPRAGQC